MPEEPPTAHIIGGPELVAGSPARRSRRPPTGSAEDTDPLVRPESPGPLDDEPRAGQPVDVSGEELSGDEVPTIRQRASLAPLPVGRFGDYRGPGYDDPSLMAGRPLSSKIHIGALLLAAGADIGAFSQVISLVMPDSEDVLIYLVVAGFTATVLYLAHVAGAMLRDRKAGLRWVRGVVAWVCLLVWVAMGVAAFYIRLRITAAANGTAAVVPGIVLDDVPTAAPTASASAAASDSVAAAVSTPSASTEDLLGALVFAALYLATGLVAAVGAYLSHNPVRGGYAAARREHRGATRRAARAAEAYYLARADWMTQLSRTRGVDTVLREEQDQRREFADELKQYARLVIAQKAHDPALTDALFDPDRHPYDRPAPTNRATD